MSNHDPKLPRYRKRWTAGITTCLILSLCGLILSIRWLQAASGSVGLAFNVDNTARREAIKSAFDHAWRGYYRGAFPHDELRSWSNQPSDSRNGWAATPIDALGTAILMGKRDVVESILRHVATIDFESTETPISLFESTIRYLGGMLSAYELLTGPFQSWQIDAHILLSKSISLADVLALAFDLRDDLPSSELTLEPFKGNGRQSLAEAGTLLLEWAKLSELTGNTTYRQLAQRAEDALITHRSDFDLKFPGMKGDRVDVATGEGLPSSVSWAGSSDSYYEYLLKTAVYDKSRYKDYSRVWSDAADFTMSNLTSKSALMPDKLFLGRVDGQAGILRPQSGHLEGFVGGNFLLGGIALNSTRYQSFGLRLVDSFHHVYSSTSTGIGPETFMWRPDICDAEDQTSANQLEWACPQPPSSQSRFAQEHGYWITDGLYNLRPEVVESYYYAYRVTKDSKYRDWAWEAWRAIDRVTRTPFGYNAVVDVDSPFGGPQGGRDMQESYFFSETLKYLFLIFDDGDDEWQIKSEVPNDWVFSTEGHPLKVL